MDRVLIIERIEIMKNILLLVLLSCSFIQCMAQDKYERAIEYLKNDSTLYKGLYLEEAEHDLSKLYAGSFEYRVHSQIVNEIILEDGESCLKELEVPTSVLDYYSSVENRIDTVLSKYSSSSTTSVHVFFTDDFSDYLGLSVFYFEEDRVSEKFRRYPYIWYTNHGVFYLFKYHPNSSKIETVCKVDLIYN